jgi:hypothetical protein
MKRLILSFSFAVILVCCFVPYILHAQSSSAWADDLQKVIDEDKQQINEWQRDAYIQRGFLAVVFVFGVAIAALQKSDKRSSKVATVTLGLLVTVFTGIKPFVFTADYHALQQASDDVRGVVSSLEITLSTLKQVPPTDQNWATLQGRFSQEQGKLQQIRDRLNGKQVPGDTAPEQAALWRGEVVYAQASPPMTQNLPEWVRELPSGAETLYFRGQAEGASLNAAQQAALNDAYDHALIALKPSAPNASSATVLAVIKASAITNSAFAYDKQRHSYSCYALLHISKTIESALKALPAAPRPPTIVFQTKGWRPTDLSSDDASGLFGLDSDGSVSKLVADGSGPHVQRLFRLDLVYRGVAIAATPDSVLVASNSKLGCTVFKYVLASRVHSFRLMGQEHCAGIASDGAGFYLSIPDRQEVRYWKSWEAQSYQSWSLGADEAPGTLGFDRFRQRLIAACSSGKAYALSPASGTKQLLGTDLGAVTSIAASQLHVLLASGNKILFVSQSDNRRESSPPDLRTLTGGQIVGVAVDANGEIWFADHDKGLVKGPYFVG